MKTEQRRELAKVLCLVMFVGVTFTACAVKGKKDLGMPGQPAAVEDKRGPFEEIQIETLREDAYHMTLPNGLHVYLMPVKRVPLVTIVISARNGSFAQAPGYEGLAHLYEHMFFKANKRISSQEKFMERLQELGVELGPTVNAYTSDESVGYYMTAQASRLEEGLSFLSDAAVDPLFLKEELEKESRVVLSEIDRADSIPSVAFARRMVRELFSKYPGRKDPWGNREVVSTATPEKMQFIRNTYYVASNCAVIVSGDIDVNKTARLVAGEFSRWEAGSDPFKSNPVPEQLALQSNQIFILNEDVKTPQIKIAFQGAKFNKDPRGAFSATVLAEMLRAKYSRFQKKLVESGLAMDASFDSDTSRYTSTDTFSVETSVDKVLELNEVLLGEIAALSEPGYFSDDEIAWAKDGIQVQDSYHKEEHAARALHLGGTWPLLGTDYYFKFAEEIAAVQRKDIEAYLATYVTKRPFVFGMMISKEDQKKVNLTEESLRTSVK